MKKVKILFLALLTLNSLAFAKATSSYSSIVSKDCKEVTAAYYPELEDIGGAVLACQGKDGWKVLLVNYDTKTWLELAKNGKIYSPIKYIEQHKWKNYGNFLKTAEKAEWRYKDGKLQAIIFRIRDFDPKNGKVNSSKLFVINLSGKKPKYCGMAQTNEEAAALADKGNCSGLLEESSY